MSFRWSNRGEDTKRGDTARAGVVVVALFACVTLFGCDHKAPVGGPLEVVAKIGESGSAPGQFGYPRCLDHDEDSLWVIDKLARVQRLDPKTGNVLEVWRTPKYDNGKPTGVTLWTPALRENTPGQSPLLFVADTHEHRVLVYALRSAAADMSQGLVDQPPTLVASFGSYGTGDGQMIYPTDICVVPAQDGSIEKLFVSEYGDNDRVSIWVPRPNEKADAAGGSPNPNPSRREGLLEFEYQSSFGTFGDGVSADSVQFSRPQAMTLAMTKSLGRVLLIADACNHRVGVFTLEGNLLRWIRDPAGPSDKPGGFTYPYGICDLEDGTVMVAEYGNCRLQRIDVETGESLGIFGERGRGQAQLSTPWAVTRLNDKLYVLDSGNSRILVIEAPRGKPKPLSSSPQLAHSGASDASGGAH